MRDFAPTFKEIQIIYYFFNPLCSQRLNRGPKLHVDTFSNQMIGPQSSNTTCCLKQGKT